jgi:hypothetical protein
MVHDEPFGLQPLNQSSSKIRIVLNQQDAYADLPCVPGQWPY